MDWQPAETAPSKTRVLVADDKGHVQVARRVPLRWYTDAEALLDPPLWWMPLPAAPAAAPKPSPRKRKS
jgi:hypothetical protein